MPRVLQRVVASEQERWPSTTIELVVQPGIPIALGDNTYIEQLVRNLVGNAAKYALRTAAVQVVATATLGAVVAYGGLGRYIIDGIARNEFDRLLAGVVLVAGLAIAVELALAVVQRELIPRGVRSEVRESASALV